MRETGTGALGRFVRSGRESLCLVRARGDALVLETLYLAEDVYSDAEIIEAVGTAEVKEPELELAHQIIDSLGGSFEPAALTSAYRRDLQALLEAKLRRCRAAAAERARGRAAPAVDLLEALKASVEAAKTGGDRASEGRSRRAEGEEARGEITLAKSRELRHAIAERHSTGVSRGDRWRHPVRVRESGQACCATGRPLAWSCAWNRCLSILPW